MSVLPSPLIEASNGMLLGLLAWMVFFGLWYLSWKWQYYSDFYYFRQDERVRAAIALMVLLFGLIVRIGVLWLIRHMENANYDTQQFKTLAPVLFMAGNTIMIWGALCWMKEIIPVTIGRWTWVLVAGSSAIFGVGMAWQ